jgi:hypothetical protein
VTPVPGTNDKADILVETLAPTEVPDRVVLEVKNVFESFYASSGEILELIKKALLMKATPVLAAPHFSSEKAMATCRDLGIQVLNLKRQLLPRTHGRIRLRTEMRKLQAANLIGPEPIEFISRRFFQEGVLSEQAQADLTIVSDPDWLSATGANWEVKFAEIEEAVREEKTFSAVVSRVEELIADANRRSGNIEEPAFY